MTTDTHDEELEDLRAALIDHTQRLDETFEVIEWLLFGAP